MKVNDTANNNVANANILAYNSSGALIINLTTNASGWTNISSLIDYINSNNIRNYYSNYTINASHTCYETILSYSHNITEEKNIFDVFNLSNFLPCVFLNSPENNSNVTGNYATLNFTIEHPIENELMEVWVYGSDDTKNFNTSWLYHRKNLLQETYTYNWSGMVVQPDDSTVLLLHLDNRSEFGENQTLAYDFSGNGNNGTCFGATCPVFSWGGKFAGAFNFDGVNDYIDFPADAAGTSATGMTVSAWIKFKSLKKEVLVAKNDQGSGTQQNEFVIYWDPNDYWRVYVEGNNIDFLGIATPQIGEWRHYAFIVNTTSDSVSLYFDGVLQETKTVTIPDFSFDITGYDWSIGQERDGATRGDFINALIDELAIWNRALSLEEISFLAKFPGKHYWQVNVSNGTKSTISDVWEFNLTIPPPPIPPLEFYQYPTVSFYNETVEIILFETNRAVNGTIEYWSISDKSDAKIKNLTDYSIVHEFNITELTKGTKYNYTINLTNFVNDEQFNLSFNSSFLTADYSLTSFKFVVVGDMRAQSGPGVQADIFGNITARIIAINPDLVINVGDVVESQGGPGDSYDTAKNAWKEYTDVVWNLTDHIPNFISIGNHENPDRENSLRRYREVVTFPLNGNGSNTCDNSNTAPCWNETTYWFRYGKSLFISLNSEEKGNVNKIIGNQLDWLNKTLNMTGFTNKFVFLHKPIKGESVVTNHNELDQMFDYYNVTAVFAGDKHYYCRNNTATLYIISGGGGAPLVSAANCKAIDNAKYKEYHFVNITVNGNTIYGNAINMSNGAVLDTFEWTTPS